MPIYRYTAKDIHSKTIKGEMEAADPRQLATALRETECFLLSYREKAAREETIYKLKADELSDYSRQIGTMLGSGVSLVRALQIMLQRGLKERLKIVYNNIYLALQRGTTISEAMAAQGKAFPELMVNMFRAGESSGHLENTAMKMAAHYEKEHRLNNKLKSAMTYPMILIILTLGIMLLIFTVVLPSFFDLFEGVELPIYTQILIGISNGLTHYWYVILIAVLCLIAGWSMLLRVEKVRLQVDKWKLRVPKIGRLLRIIYTARFARTLCSLYTSGLSMIQALRISSDIIGNHYISNQFGDVIREVRNGQPLSRAIQLVDGFDPKLASTIYVGEETGRLDDMLESVADSFDYESEIATQKMVTILEPLLIVIMALLIGFVMVSVMVPIYTLYNTMGSTL